MNARELALSALVAAHRSGGYVQDELHALMSAHGLAPADRALAMQIALGTTRHRRTLDHLLRTLLREAIETLPAAARFVLESAAYQIVFLDRVPDYAVVNEAVALMRRHGQSRRAGLANAVLRRLPRLLDRDTPPERVRDVRRRLPSPLADAGGCIILAKPLLPADPVRRLAVALSFPDALVERWAARWGRRRTARVLEALNRPPRVFARVNSLRSTPQELRDVLGEPSRDACQTPRPDVLDLTELPHGTLVRLLARGVITVEDPTAMLAVEALGVEPGQSVLDLCAAPGGKTSYIAELLRGQGAVTAVDRGRERLDLLRQTVERLRLSNVHVVDNDGPAGFGTSKQAFDRVLVDVPCTNTGVLNRRADARWRFSARRLRSLATVQQTLLEQAARATRVGGLCVYSTCSMEPEENAGRVRAFLSAAPWMVLQVERETLPSADGDGGYFARLARVGEG